MSIRWFVSGGGLRARAGVGESAVRFVRLRMAQNSVLVIARVTPCPCSHAQTSKTDRFPTIPILQLMSPEVRFSLQSFP